MNCNIIKRKPIFNKEINNQNEGEERRILILFSGIIWKGMRKTQFYRRETGISAALQWREI